ncbi:hypothetical protein QBC38DRAFT_450617 [Podospora fimiseda]|uniref:Uncharacterized protein n=1 Tax=Podospora fimiseda TaxID=252190 RepID=A0AAN7BYT8_9PEZI|nr:hypothetical protein QBC38DRAFT_450617 [Podospora fimiseda]
MQKQAQLLVQSMKLGNHKPETVRLLTHTLPHLELKAFDALTGKSFILKKREEGGTAVVLPDWGEEVEEIIDDDFDAEEESEISDLDWDD